MYVQQLIIGYNHLLQHITKNSDRITIARVKNGFLNDNGISYRVFMHLCVGFVGFFIGLLCFHCFFVLFFGGVSKKILTFFLM